MADPDSPQTRNRSLYHSDEGSTRRYTQFERVVKKTRQVEKSEKISDSESEENVTNKSFSWDTQNKKENVKNISFWKNISFLLVIVVLAIIILRKYSYLFGGSSPEQCEFRGLTEEDLRSHFLNQPKDLSYIVDTILENDRNSVDSLVLLHSSESDSTARCLANKLTEIYAYKKRNECRITTIRPTDVNTSDDDFGEVLKKYVREKNGTAAVVQNLLGIASNKAQIFHTMCDDTIPTNIPSLFVFTLLSSSDPSNFPHREARNILSSAWKDLPDNVLDPLLARILGHVVKVSPEKKLPC